MKVTFNIKPVDIDGYIKIADGKALPEKIYNGKPHTFSSKELANLFVESSTGITVPAKSMKMTYSNNVNAGKATMTITGSGNYTGKTNITYTIKPKNADNLYISIQKVVPVPAGWTEGTPVYTVIKSIKSSFFSFSSLKEGKDYVYVCTNNTKKGNARVVITCKGNYSGTKTLYYKIK